ncbi:MAG TPA: hypothetical protein VKX28_18935 [Xanthobacteraceae bacterium]|nr:hypothetical protein [Xanthobacteraceae bacterium]
MSRRLILVFLLLILGPGASHAEVLKLRCNKASGESNVDRIDLVIDLAKRTVQMQQFSTFKDSNKTLKYWNHNDGFVVDEYVSVSNERVEWGEKPKSAIDKVYHRQTKMLDDGFIGRYRCADAGAPAR